MNNEQKDRMMKKRESLSKIGKKIGAIYEIIGPYVDTITKEELEKFWNYLVKQDAIFPITDPTYYNNGGKLEIEKGLERVRILRILKEGKWKIQTPKEAIDG